MTTLLAAILAPTGAVIVALIGYLGFRRLRDAQTGRTNAETGKTNAETGKTEAEAWALLTGGLTVRLTALEAENQALRVRVTNAEDEARSCRAEVEDLRRHVAHLEGR